VSFNFVLPFCSVKVALAVESSKASTSRADMAKVRATKPRLNSKLGSAKVVEISIVAEFSGKNVLLAQKKVCLLSPKVNSDLERL